MPSTLLVRPLVAGAGLTTILTALGSHAPAAAPLGPPPTSVRAQMRADDAFPDRGGPAAVAPRRGARREVDGPVRIDPRALVPAGDRAVAEHAERSPIRIHPLPGFRAQSHASAAAGDEPAGCTLAVGMATAYAARGLNLFQHGAQQDVAGLLAPGVECALGESEFVVGWLGAFQVSGVGAATLVAEGVGAENDIYVAVEHELADNVSAGAALTAIVYPLARGPLPVYLEPSVHIGWSPGVDLDLQLLYSAGVHGTDGVAPYVYVHPTIAREFELDAVTTLQLGAGGGWKGYPPAVAVTDNTWDVQVDATLQRNFGRLGVAPGVHAAWTNLAGQPFVASCFVWASLDLQVAL